MSEMWIRILVGMDEDDDLLVVGAMDEQAWDSLPEEDEERLWRQMQETWAPDYQGYVWRQVRVKLDRDKVFELLAMPELVAEVKAAE